MKRSEFKDARVLFYRACGWDDPGLDKYAEQDTSIQEKVPGFPGWDPEEPEKERRTGEPEWFEWTGPYNTYARCSLTGKFRGSHAPDYEEHFNESSWAAAFITAIRQLVAEKEELEAKLDVSEEDYIQLRDVIAVVWDECVGNRRLQIERMTAELASLRARDITQQEEIRRLRLQKGGVAVRLFRRRSDRPTTELRDELRDLFSDESQRRLFLKNLSDGELARLRTDLHRDLFSEPGTATATAPGTAGEAPSRPES